MYRVFIVKIDLGRHQFQKTSIFAMPALGGKRPGGSNFRGFRDDLETISGWEKEVIFDCVFLCSGLYGQMLTQKPCIFAMPALGGKRPG